MQILHDVDQPHGEDAQDLKEHIDHTGDESRDLADFTRRQPPPPAPVPAARPRVEMPAPIIIRPEPVQMPVPQSGPPPLPVLVAPPLLCVKDILGGGSSPIPEPSDVSSETSPTMRRYLDWLRDPRRFDMPQLGVPRPVRLHPPSLDTEWVEFLNSPTQAADRPIQGPPLFILLVHHTVGIPRVESPSPTLILSLPRSQSVPLSGEGVRLYQPLC